MWTTLLLQVVLQADAAEPRTVPIGPELREVTLALPASVSDPLRAEAWPEARDALRAMPEVSGLARADWAFLVAWTSTKAGTPEQAADVLQWMSGPYTAPESYVRVARGSVLQAGGDSEQALELFDGVDPGSPLYATAALGAAEALRATGREAAARERVERLLDRPDPVAGTAPLLQSLIDHHGPDSPEALPLLQRLWVHYPSEPEGQRAQGLLEERGDHAPGWQQVAQRAERLMEAEEYDQAISETDAHVSHQGTPSEAGCRLRYTRGRSHYKRNRLRAAAATFEGIGAQCKDAPGAYGPRGLYLLGTTQYRRKEFASSAEAYRSLAELYPTSSMADDAWTRGGISLLEAGEDARAAAWWKRSLDDHPDGDTVPEAALRLAFARYDRGDPTGAIEIAERLTELPVQGNAVHIDAGRYWAARWRYYPDARAPRQATDAADARGEAIDRWAELCRNSPHSFYAILAYSRLVEVSPTLAEQLKERPRRTAAQAVNVPWQPRVATLTNAHFRDGVALMRVGLVQEALTEWMKSGPGEWTPDEKAWVTELRIAADDWLHAHDNFRQWIIANPLGTLGDREPQIIRLAWPDRYWSEVQNAVREEYRYDARLFHALVREESNFNRTIVSFAGARGLSQLMWRTAQQTAGWLDREVTEADLFEPQANLDIGARYLEAMHRQLADSPFLALAAYNGGARNVNSWVEEHDNPPLDEWVERVPFRETRGYIKRVMGTWQTMRYHFDDGDPYPDLSRYNHRAKP